MLPDWTCGEISCDVPCTLMNTVVDEVVTLAYNAVCRDMPPEFCSGLTAYVTVAEPHNPQGDYIGGWVQSMTPYNPRNSQAGGLQIIARTLVAVGLKLLETGWPMIGQPEPDDIPPLSAVNALAHHVNSHGERIYRALVNACSTRAITPSGCQYQGMGPMAPVPPAAGMVGWTYAVQLAVTW